MTQQITGAEREKCDDKEVMRLWRQAGGPEYFLGNGGTNHMLVEFARLCALQTAQPTDDLSQPSALKIVPAINTYSNPVVGEGKIWDGEKWLNIAPSMEAYAVVNLAREIEKLKAQPAGDLVERLRALKKLHEGGEYTGREIEIHNAAIDQAIREATSE